MMLASEGDAAPVSALMRRCVMGSSRINQISVCIASSVLVSAIIAGDSCAIAGNRDCVPRSRGHS